MGTVTTPTEGPFEGALRDDLIPTVRINGQPAAVAGSGGSHQSGTGRILSASATVLIGGRPAARLGDPVVAQDAGGAPNGSGAVVTGPATVFIG